MNKLSPSILVLAVMSTPGIPAHANDGYYPGAGRTMYLQTHSHVVEGLCVPPAPGYKLENSTYSYPNLYFVWRNGAGQAKTISYKLEDFNDDTLTNLPKNDLKHDSKRAVSATVAEGAFVQVEVNFSPWYVDDSDIRQFLISDKLANGKQIKNHARISKKELARATLLENVPKQDMPVPAKLNNALGSLRYRMHVPGYESTWDQELEGLAWECQAPNPDGGSSDTDAEESKTEGKGESNLAL